MFDDMHKALRDVRQLGEDARARRDARRRERSAGDGGAVRVPAHLAEQVCAAACEGCGATIENTVRVFVERIARNRARCDRCGKALAFPEVVTELVDALSRVGSADLHAPVDYRCPQCDRSLTRPLGELAELVQRSRAKCQLCGTDLELPPEVYEAAGALAESGRGPARRSVACPVCDRGVADDGAGGAKCAFCGVAFAVRPGCDHGLPPAPRRAR